MAMHEDEQNSIFSQKTRLRKFVRSEIAVTSMEWLAIANRLLVSNIQKFISQKEKKISYAFLGWIPHFGGEADLLSLMETGCSNFYCPSCAQSGELKFFKMPCELLEGVYGILEPDSKAGRPLKFSDYEQIVCFIPGLAFDRSGGRLGRGMGMYDKFLSQIPKDMAVVRVGVCWTFQLFDSVPTEVHDLKMDFICTEQELVIAEGGSKF